MGNITLDQDENDQSFDIIPDIDWSGEAEILFSATDGSKSKSGTVQVIVKEVPDQPRFEEYPKVFESFEDVSSNFTIKLFDVDSFNMTLSTTTSWAIITTNKTDKSIFDVNITPTDQYLGETFLTLIASDGDTQNVEQTITVNVNPTNDPPRVISPIVRNATRGEDLEIDLVVEDPDGDFEFTVGISWEHGNFNSEYTNFTLQIPEGDKTSEYIVSITVDDGNGGITLHELTVNIREKESEDFSLVLIVMIALIFSFLLVYGVFLRLQERKQKRMLDSVGTSAPIEARPLSEKDFKKRRRRGKKKDEGLPMPPAPLEVEGALAREEGGSEEDDTKIYSSGQDLESDLDDLLSEMFP